MNEIWKDIPGYEGKYQVSNLARVKSLPQRIRYQHYNGVEMFRLTYEKILKQRLNHGYPYISLHLGLTGEYKTHKVHRLIAEAFIPNPENKRCVNHKNGVRDDNRLDNLEWATHSENNLHAFRVLKKQAARGEDSGMSKLKESDVREIRRLHKFHCSERQIAKIIGNVDRSTVRGVINGLTWRHVL